MKQEAGEIRRGSLELGRLRSGSRGNNSARGAAIGSPRLCHVKHDRTRYGRLDSNQWANEDIGIPTLAHLYDESNWEHGISFLRL